MADVFICYAREDKDFALKLRDGLREQKREVRIDLKDIPPTEEWWTEICTHIVEADNFVFVISPDSCASDTCKEEVAYAEANHKRLIPVVSRQVSAKELPPAIAPIQWISFSDDAFETAFQSLIEALDRDSDWVRSHTRVLVRASEWERNARDSSFLLRGTDLQNAIKWLARSHIEEPEAVGLQEEYILASQEREAGEIRLLDERRRETERHQRIAVARERVAHALSSLEEDPERSLLLSIHAVHATWPHDATVFPETEDAVHRALRASRIRLVIRDHFAHGLDRGAVASTQVLTYSQATSRWSRSAPRLLCQGATAH